MYINFAQGDKQVYLPVSQITFIETSENAGTWQLTVRVGQFSFIATTDKFTEFNEKLQSILSAWKCENV